MNRRHSKKLLSTLFSSLIILGSCSGGGGSGEPSFDQSAMLKQLVDNVILPSYQDFSNQGQNLSTSLQTLCGTVNESNLQAAQNSWKNAQGALKTIEGFSFGPYTKLGLEAKLDFWPTRPDDIETTIANNPEFNKDSVANLGAAVKGLPALEYLLFNPSGDNATIVSALSDSKRCAYLKALGEDVSANVTLLYNAWAPEQGSYGLSLATAGQGSQDYPSLNTAINDIINNMSSMIEQAKDTKLGKPLGYKDGGVAQPNSVESPYSHYSLQDLIRNFEGLQDFYLGSYNGSAGLGLHHFVQSKSVNLASDMDIAIAEAITALKAIPEPLSQSVLDQHDLVDAAYVKVRNVQDLLRGPISSLLGVTVSFSDSDGD